MECFCGCGRDVKGMRSKAANAFGAELRPMLTVFEGAAARGEVEDTTGELRALVDEGRAHGATLTAVVHGESDRRDVDKSALRDWSSRAAHQSTDLFDRASALGWQGPALRLVELVFAGARAPGTVDAVTDTGMTVNEHPQVAITVAVRPVDGPAFSLSRKVTVSRVALPRLGEAVEVAHPTGEPIDSEDFAYRLAPVAAVAVADADAVEVATRVATLGDDRLDRVRQAGELFAAGILTQAEFEAEKQRILREPTPGA